MPTHSINIEVSKSDTYMEGINEEFKSEEGIKTRQNLTT